jgi:hypothetical protein
MNLDGLLRGFGISRLQESEAMREGERGRHVGYLFLTGGDWG